MYVHVAVFTIKEGDDITFIEMQKFEEIQDAKKNGLDHFHILRDRTNPHKYWLLEYWETKDARDKYEELPIHKEFHKNRAPIMDGERQSYECDLLV